MNLRHARRCTGRPEPSAAPRPRRDPPANRWWLFGAAYPCRRWYIARWNTHIYIYIHFVSNDIYTKYTQNTRKLKFWTKRIDKRLILNIWNFKSALFSYAVHTQTHQCIYKIKTKDRNSFFQWFFIDFAGNSITDARGKIFRYDDKFRNFHYS